MPSDSPGRGDILNSEAENRRGGEWLREAHRNARIGLFKYIPATDDLTRSPDTVQGLDLHPDDAELLGESLRTTCTVPSGMGGR